MRFKQQLPGLLMCLVFIGLENQMVAQEDAPAYPMKPSPEHAVMKLEEGVWEGSITMWMQGPDGPVTKSEGVEKVELLGGMWSMSTITYDFMGSPTSGHGMIGYDPLKKKYVGSWYEAGSPYQTTMEGSYNKEKKELTMNLSGRDMDGQPAEYRSVTRHVDKDHRTFTMYGKMPGGDEMVKMMVIEYTRKQ